MGSVHGTFVLLKHGQARRMHKGQTYQIGGSEIYLNVIDVRMPKKQTKSEKTLFALGESTGVQIDSAESGDKLCQESPIDKDEVAFMQYLASEYEKGVLVHGLPKESYVNFCSCSPELA